MRMVLIFLLMSSVAMAQDSLWTEAALLPGRAIKLSPLHLLNFYPTLQVSYEQSVGDRVALQLEGGYVMEYVSREDYQDRRGFKAKFETRYYLSGVARKRKLYYTAGEVYGNFVNFDRTDQVEDCFDVGCTQTFTQTRRYLVKYREQGLNVKFGYVRYLRFETRAFMDVSVGLSLRNIRYKKPFEMGEIDEDFFGGPAPNERDRFAVSPYGGLRFGYKL